MNRTGNKILGIITALAGILIIIYISFFATVVKDSFLHETNRKLHIAEYLQMSEEDLEAVTTSMVSFVMGEQETLQVQVEMAGVERGFFNEKEIVHIGDVRDLISSLRMFITVCGIVFLVGTLYLWKNRQLPYLAKGYFIGLLFVAVLAMVVGILAVTDITMVINGFHYLFFDNDLWIMNPATDKVIYLFTEDMYLDAIIRIGGCLGILLLGAMAGALVILKRKSIR
uniref:TIGR01906 family membrane protein n=1 Tax=Agathobacter sp. TaxID=2021311 RepID=UPI0040564481